MDDVLRDVCMLYNVQHTLLSLCAHIIYHNHRFMSFAFSLSLHRLVSHDLKVAAYGYGSVYTHLCGGYCGDLLLLSIDTYNYSYIYICRNEQQFFLAFVDVDVVV